MVRTVCTSTRIAIFSGLPESNYQWQVDLRSREARLNNGEYPSLAPAWAGE